VGGGCVGVQGAGGSWEGAGSASVLRLLGDGGASGGQGC